MQRSLAVGVAIPIALTAVALFFLEVGGVLLVALSGGSPAACMLWYARAEKRSRQGAVAAAFKHGAEAGRLYP